MTSSGVRIGLVAVRVGPGATLVASTSIRVCRGSDCASFPDAVVVFVLAMPRVHRANLLRALLRGGSWQEADRVALDVAPMVGEIASARTEKALAGVAGKLRSAMSLPSTLGDALRDIGRQVGDQP